VILPWDGQVQCWRFKDTLTQIFLNDNNIQTLPQNIAILHALRELHLERNGLCCLPYVMCQMTTLQVLNLTDNSDMYDPPYDIVTEQKLKGIMKYLRAMHMAPMLKSLVLQDFEVGLLPCSALLGAGSLVCSCAQVWCSAARAHKSCALVVLCTSFVLWCSC
jgi:hypothetical protein